MVALTFITITITLSARNGSEKQPFFFTLRTNRHPFIPTSQYHLHPHTRADSESTDDVEAVQNLSA